MTPEDLDRRLTLARTLADEASTLALGYFRDGARLGTRMKGFQDFLTEADGAVEALLRRRVAEIFPEDGFLGEETGGTAAERLWIVDPIDGTANFARGEPYWCVSIGFLAAGRPRLGVIRMPMLDETFEAVDGKGAYLNGLPISVAGTTDMRVATVEIGWSTRRPTSTYLTLVGEAMRLGANVKRSASGALGMCWVACGRTDAYLELHINSWDVAGGLVIAREAGAAVNDFFAGDALTAGNPILAATPALAEPLAGAMGLEARSLQRRH